MSDVPARKKIDQRSRMRMVSGDDAIKDNQTIVIARRLRDAQEVCAVGV